MNNTFTSRAIAAAVLSAATVLVAPTVGLTAEKEAPLRACYVTPSTIDCYPSERDLYTAYPELKDPPQGELQATRTIGFAAAAATCSTTLKLYTSTSYGGSLYVFNTRQQAINLPAGHAANNAASGVP
jgi:hypothetical protein